MSYVKYKISRFETVTAVLISGGSKEDELLSRTRSYLSSQAPRPAIAQHYADHLTTRICGVAVIGGARSHFSAAGVSMDQVRMFSDKVADMVRRIAASWRSY